MVCLNHFGHAAADSLFDLFHVRKEVVFLLPPAPMNFVVPRSTHCVRHRLHLTLLIEISGVPSVFSVYSMKVVGSPQLMASSSNLPYETPESTRISPMPPILSILLPLWQLNEVLEVTYLR